MGKRLVTIATFDQPTPAHLAKNALDEAGIQATLADASLVSMDWLLSNAIGGIKVQVWEDDADKAIAVLENNFGEHGEGLGVKVTPDDLAAQAQAAIPDEGEERPEPISPLAAAEPDPPKSERDEYARRAVLTSILGLMIPPVAGYALYLYMNATFGEGEISQTGRLNRSIALVLALAGLAWLPFYFTFLLD